MDIYKILLKAMIIMIMVYFALFAIWYETSPNHRPTSKFYDMRREGYKLNPLHDRKQTD